MWDSSQLLSTSWRTLSSRRSARASDSVAASTRASDSPRCRIACSSALRSSRFTKNAVNGPAIARDTAIDSTRVRFTPSVAILAII
jgi:hypothetical protein